MRDRIIAELTNRSEVSDWIIQETLETKTESYYVGIDVESTRTIDSHYCSVTLFNRHNGSIGDTTFRITSDDHAGITRAIDEGVFIARGVSNPDFELPGPQEYPEIELVDIEISTDPLGVHARNHDLLLNISASLPAELKLASAELHLDYKNTSLVSSTGMAADQFETSVIFDVVLVSDTRFGQSEQLVVVRRRRYNDIGFDDVISQNAEYALDKSRRNIASSGVIPIVFNPSETMSLLRPLITHASMDSQLKKYSRFNAGEQVIPKLRNEPVTMIADATIPLALGSTRFSDFGIPGQKTVIIEDGMFLNRWGTHDVACWLGMKPTGSFGNIVLKHGNTPGKNLLHDSGPVLEIVAFSDLIPNPVTGDFIAEIRFGYLHDSHGKTPVTGGVVSGNVFTMFERATFSRETTVFENYHGPSRIRFEEIQVTGE